MAFAGTKDMRKQYRHILHATDFSLVSEAAFGHAVTLAREHRAVLSLVHVVPDVAPFVVTPEIGAVAAARAYRTAHATARRQAEASMNGLMAAAREAGVRARARVVEGVAHERIVDVARRNRVDLIVMGTHGRTGLARWFIGSVASRVIAAAPCPVLTLRTEARGRTRSGTRRATRRRAA